VVSKCFANQVRLWVLWPAMATAALGASAAEVAPPQVRALGRQLRIDLMLDAPLESNTVYQVRRAQRADGPFVLMPYHTIVPVFTDFVGEPNKTFYYQVRSGREDNRRFVPTSAWSNVVSAATQSRDRQSLLAEVQEASVRYFTLASHPRSGMALEWLSPRKWPSQDRSGRRPGATGGTGMGLSNMVVAVERGFLDRGEACRKLLRTLRFLDSTAERFHGAYAHWIDNESGKPIPFSRYDDGGDLVETALLAQGLILVREYFDGESPQEVEIRRLSDHIWRSIEWDWYRRDGAATLYWHWSPRFGWKMNLPITGFCEAEIVYILAIASPTHPVPANCFFRGWRGRWFGSQRNHYGVDLQLGRGLGGCTFWYYYSYIGLDPARITYQGRTMRRHFEDLCTVQIRYMRAHAGRFKGYDRMWGLTASPGPNGYRAHKPGKEDDGTITPAASLSAFVYAPTQDWFCPTYLAIDAGTVAPMLENYRNGLLWRLFMNAPEIKQALRKLEAQQPGTVAAAGR